MAAQAYTFGPSEQPTFEGGPYVPAHHPYRRMAYLAAGLLIGLSAQLGNALATVNLVGFGGSLAISPAQASWLISAYVAANASANLLLVRARIRFGIPSVTLVLLSMYVAAALLQLCLPSYASAMIVRLASGAVATALTAVAVFHLLQVVPQHLRALALLVGVSLSQLAIPIARLLPVAMLSVGQWRGLALFELAIALGVMALLVTVRLPPSIRGEGFRALDIASFGLIFPAMLLFSGAIGAGRYLWWTDAPWIGVALCASLALFGAVLILEQHRSRPLVLTDWISSADMVRFAAVALLIRFALTEQTYGAIGLLSAGGVGNDQLHTLFGIVLAASVLGIIAAVATLSPTRLPAQVMVAALLVAAGAWLDSGSNSLTRAPQLYLSQALLGFGASLFIGPALLYGFVRVLQLGQNYLISFLVLFSVTQNVGGLIGASLLGTYQTVMARTHAAALAEQIVAADAQVAGRLVGQGAAGLHAALQREAAFLAFNDVFRLVAIIALLTALYVAYRILIARRYGKSPVVAGAAR